MRVSHWLLAACIAAAWLTRDARLVDLHAASGYCALFLVAFRFLWGFAGTVHARFADFLYSPREALAYVVASLRGAPAHFTGHNPAGSWSVYFLLAGATLTSFAGIIAIAGMFGMAPVPIALDASGSNAAREVHEWLAWGLLVVIAVHVLGAVASSMLHRENLVASMVTGRKIVHEHGAVPVPARAPIAFALVASALALVVAYLHWAGWFEDYATQRARARGANGESTAWSKECGGCHLAYPPSFLPDRSWERMLAEQKDHFGEDLSLGPATTSALLAFARMPRSVPWAAAQLQASARPQDTPQRVSELRFWRHAHRRLDAAAFKPPISAGRHDCEACHIDAASGIFQPRMIHRPARESIL